MRKWEDDIPEVRRLAEQEKLHAADIGRALGATKHAIIGLCRRNDIKLHHASGNRDGRPASGSERTRRWRARRAPATAPIIATVAPQPSPSVIRMPASHIRFGDLRLLSSSRVNECRNFLPGESGVDGLVCADATPPGQPWCQACRARVYTKLRATPKPRFELGQWTLGADAGGLG